MSEVLTNGIKVPDKGSRSWYDDMRGDLVKLDALIGSASSVTVNPIITSGIEIASINVNGTAYSLYQQDGDIAVNIKPVTTNEELPIILSKSTEENTDTVNMSVGVTVNPSSNTITASSFVGALTGNATTATSATKATQDASGNVITSTYATKTENNTKANSSDLTSHTTNGNIHVTASDKTNWNNKSTFSGSYNDLTNKPIIPTVNNATLTIQKNGTTVETFSANASANTTANITVPTKTSDLTNDSGFINIVDSVLKTNTDYIFRNYFLNSLNIDEKYDENYVVGISVDGHGTRPVSGWTNIINSTCHHFITQLCIQINSNSMYARSRWVDDTTWSEWVKLAKDSDVVHLTGDETINGTKTFNGNVYATNVNTSYITTNSDTPLRMVYGSYGAFWRNDGTNLYLMLTNKDDQYGDFNSFRPIQVSLSTGKCYINGVDPSGIVLAFCSSAVSNGSTVAGSTLKVATGGTGGAFTASTETLTGTYRAYSSCVANGVGLFFKIV